MRSSAKVGIVLAALGAGAIVGCRADGERSGVDEWHGPPRSDGVNPLAYDRDVFQFLLQDHAKIRREVAEVEGGVRTVTESDDPVVAARIVDHAESMKRRLHAKARLRQWDPIFVAMFDHADDIKMTVERTGKGVIVTETSAVPRVAALIREHARVVSGFVAHGVEEASNEHPVPAEAR
jgi:hypothetical protein